MVNGVELRDLDASRWHRLLSWGRTRSYPPPRFAKTFCWPGRKPAKHSFSLRWIKPGERIHLATAAGINTPVGDQAGRLSVGQAQRIAVARALLVPCRLLLLDEPAASLDAHSEQRVMQALFNASSQQTTLMVTHQLEGIAD